jgi:hypothetical protein
MHGKAAETQVLISTDWIANISIRGVALFVSEAIDRHRQKLNPILEILIHMRSRGPVHIKVTLTKGFRSSLVAGKSAKPISNELETLLHSFRVLARLIEVTTLGVNLGMQTLYGDGIRGFPNRKLEPCN